MWPPMHRLMESENMPTLQFVTAAENASMNLTERYIEEAGSTNDEGSAWLKTAAAGAALSVWTAHQTQGRGQRGNAWEQEKGLDLAWTLAIKWTDGAQRWQPIAFNKAVSASLCKAIGHLVAAHDVECGIKWPNDILLRHRGGPWKKCAGLLIENSWKGGRWDGVCIGMGLNANSNHAEASRRCSLRDFTRASHPLASLVSALCGAAMQAVHADDRAGAYDHCLLGRQRPLRYQHCDQPGTGTIQRVDENGALVMQWHPDGGTPREIKIEHSRELEWDGLWGACRD